MNYHAKAPPTFYSSCCIFSILLIYLNNFIIYLFYLFLPCWVFIAMPVLSLVFASGGYSLVVVCRLLTLWSTGSRAQELRWSLHAHSVAVVRGLSCSVTHGNLPRPGIEPVSATLAGGFLTNRPSGKSYLFLFEM